MDDIKPCPWWYSTGFNRRNKLICLNVFSHLNGLLLNEETEQQIRTAIKEYLNRHRPSIMAFGRYENLSVKYAADQYEDDQAAVVDPIDQAMTDQDEEAIWDEMYNQAVEEDNEDLLNQLATESRKRVSYSKDPVIYRYINVWFAPINNDAAWQQLVKVFMRVMHEELNEFNKYHSTLLLICSHQLKPVMHNTPFTVSMFLGIAPIGVPEVPTIMIYHAAHIETLNIENDSSACTDTKHITKQKKKVSWSPALDEDALINPMSDETINPMSDETIDLTNTTETIDLTNADVPTDFVAEIQHWDESETTYRDSDGSEYADMRFNDDPPDSDDAADLECAEIMAELAAQGYEVGDEAEYEPITVPSRHIYITTQQYQEYLDAMSREHNKVANCYGALAEFYFKKIPDLMPSNLVI